MGVSAQAMKAISISAEHLGAQHHQAMAGASADSHDSPRSLLIETIRKNVMAWTSWDGFKPAMKLDQTRGLH
jgi:hypothetical protein